MALLMFADEQGRCWPSLARLAAVARTSRGAVRRDLAKLEQHQGLFRVRVERARRTEHGDLDSNRYVLSLVEGCDHPDPTCDHPAPTCAHPSPGVGSTEPHGCDHPGPTGVITQAPEEDTGRGQKKRTVKRGRAARWTRCPEGWEPNDAHREIARAEGVDFDRQLTLFRDHDFKVPKTDADAAFRTWLRSPYAKSNGKPTMVQSVGTIRSKEPEWAKGRAVGGAEK